jgi:hypothetical protein
VGDLNDRAERQLGLASAVEKQRIAGSGLDLGHWPERRFRNWSTATAMTSQSAKKMFLGL